MKTINKLLWLTGLRSCLLLVLGFSPFSNIAEELPPYNWTPVNDNVNVAIKPERHRFIDSNVTVIETSDFLIIVDANDNLDNALQLIDDIKARWKKPVKYVINTHWHSDHILANQLYQEHFAGKQIFIAHESFQHTLSDKAEAQLNEKRQQWSAAIKKAKLQLNSDNATAGLEQRVTRAEKYLQHLLSVQIVEPDILIKKTYRIKDANFPVEIRHFGLAHTEGDLVVWLPQQQVLIAGDLFDEISFAGHGFLKQWSEVLEHLNDLPFKVAVPGHGKLQFTKQTLNDIKQLIDDAVAKATLAHKKGVDKETFMKQVDLTNYYRAFDGSDEFTQRVSKQFIPEFFERAFELTQQAEQ